MEFSISRKAMISDLLNLNFIKFEEKDLDSWLAGDRNNIEFCDQVEGIADAVEFVLTSSLPFSPEVLAELYQRRTRTTDGKPYMYDGLCGILQDAYSKDQDSMDLAWRVCKEICALNMYREYRYDMAMLAYNYILSDTAYVSLGERAADLRKYAPGLDGQYDMARDLMRDYTITRV